MAKERPLADRAMKRDGVTWYCYLMLGFFTYLLNIQGNIIPFLKSELDLSYRAVGLHSSAIAAGMIVVGLFGDRVTRRLGRRRTLLLSGGGASIGAILLSLAPAAWASIASCALIGICGALIPSMVPAILADRHGDRRDVAITEATGASYVFAIAAPLVTSLAISLTLGWRSAVLVGAAMGAAILLRYNRLPVIEPMRTAASTMAPLPPAYWAYWLLVAIAVSLEYCVLLWAPTFLEVVNGLPPAIAARATVSFSVAMLVGRLAGGAWFRFMSSERLFLAALLVTGAGFLMYWGLSEPLVAVAGLFVLGLGIALLFPLAIGFAISAAGSQSARANARIMVAVGLALLSMPILLGGLADEVGLRVAHLLVPGLAACALACFVVSHQLQRRAVRAAS